MKNNKKNFLDRRKFFKRFGLSAFGLTVLSFFPFKIIDKSSERKKIVKVKIHPSSIRRTK
jgi:hypothetical protein